MHFSTFTLPCLTLLSKVALADEWGVWFFSDGCHDTNGYAGVAGDKDTTLTCMSPTTYLNGKAVPGPYTNIMTSNLEELGMKITLFNDTTCLDWVTTVDTDGCAVVPADNHIMGFNIGPK